jgi:hypothetical protein
VFDRRPDGAVLVALDPDLGVVGTGQASMAARAGADDATVMHD